MSLQAGATTVANVFNAAGTVTLAGGSLSVQELAVTGELNGSGTVSGLVTNSGLVSPGFSPGALTVDGDYVQTEAGTLRIEIDGSASEAGTDFDLLAVNGNASFDGTLEITALEGFTGDLGQTFAPITYESGEGAFTTVTQDTGGAVFDPVIGPSGVEATLAELDGEVFDPDPDPEPIDPENPPVPESEEEARDIAEEVINACPEERDEVVADNNTAREQQNSEGEQATQVQAPDEDSAPPGSQGVGCVTG